MDFWQHHGLIFLFGCAFFPRITTLFFSAMSFGVWHILGWIFAPHLLVAIMATVLYWQTNPILVIISWGFAFGGTGSEAKITYSRVRQKKSLIQSRWVSPHRLFLFITYKLFQKFFYLLIHFQYIFYSSFPYLFKVKTEIFMGYYIPHASHLFP